MDYNRLCNFKRVIKSRCMLHCGVRSDVDLKRWDGASHPAVARCSRAWEGFLRPGDVLYIPPGCWHFVMSVGDDDVDDAPHPRPAPPASAAAGAASAAAGAVRCEVTAEDVQQPQDSQSLGAEFKQWSCSLSFWWSRQLRSEGEQKAVKRSFG